MNIARLNCVHRIIWNAAELDPDCSFRFENSADSLKIVNIKLYSLRTSVRRSRVLKVLK